MTIRNYTIMALLGIGCLIVDTSAIAQPAPGPGPQGFMGSPSTRSYPGTMPSSNYGGPMGGGAPSSGYHSAPPMNGRPASIPSSRFSTVPDNHRTYSGSTTYPPAQSGSSMQRPPTPYSAPGAARVKQALSQKDYEAMGVESQSIRNKAKSLPEMSPDMPIQDRLKVPLLQHKYRQGLDMIDEGRDTRNDMKIQYGIQQIEDADKRINRMEHPAGPGRGNRSQR